MHNPAELNESLERRVDLLTEKVLVLEQQLKSLTDSQGGEIPPGMVPVSTLAAEFGISTKKAEELAKNTGVMMVKLKAGGFVVPEGYTVSQVADLAQNYFGISRDDFLNQAKASKFIEQIMIVGDGEKMPCALIQPDFVFIKNWAERKNINIGTTPEEIAKNPELITRIGKEIDYLNTKLGSWEQIKRFELTPEIWSIDLGLLTPTMKLKRKAIKERYLKLYNKMYGHEE